MMNNSLKMLTINITNTFFKTYYFKSNLCSSENTLEKCIFLLSSDMFNDVEFDNLETIFSNLVIDERVFKKNVITSSLNNMGNSEVVFMRTDYDVISETRQTSLLHGIDNNCKKYMVTFHFFI